MILAGLLLGAGLLLLVLQRPSPTPKPKATPSPSKVAPRTSEGSDETDPLPLQIPLRFQDPKAPPSHPLGSTKAEARPPKTNVLPSHSERPKASEIPSADAGTPDLPPLPRFFKHSLRRTSQGRPIGLTAPETPSDSPQTPTPPKHTKGSKMIYIPEGGRGSSKVDAFWIDQYEVNVEQYSQCVSDKGCKPAMGGFLRDIKVAAQTPLYYPIHSVTWEQADRFCLWAGKRLPSSREWDRAARGDEPRRYPWGEEAPDCSRAHFQECGSTLRPIGGERRSDGKSPFDIYDMAGSVWEWTSDCLETSSDRCTLRLLRGGSFRSPAKEISTTSSKKVSPSLNDPDIGIRCAWRPSR